MRSLAVGYSGRAYYGELQSMGSTPGEGNMFLLSYFTSVIKSKVCSRTTVGRIRQMGSTAALIPLSLSGTQSQGDFH